MKKYSYFFGGGRAEGNAALKDLLGGKGSGLAEMTRAGLEVPPGFTMTAELCRLYYAGGKRLPREAEAQMKAHLGRLQRLTGLGLGDPERPLLVSVRSGAKFSMPGMMDTILNLGLNDRTVGGLERRTSDPKLAWDCYRRFVEMFASVVLGVERKRFEELARRIAQSRQARSVEALEPGALRELVKQSKILIERETGRAFPEDCHLQLVMARNAVFESWNNPRAVEYRRIARIPDDIGTAVNVQVMVFGNASADSATGVGFTRDPATGAPTFYGEYLPCAQGEDVVAGTRTPKPIAELAREMPRVYRQLRTITRNLERHYRDMQDFEFTIERGRLYMLQTRSGKRSGMAALRVAFDMVREGLIRPEEALLRVEPGHLEQLLHPVFDPEARQRFEVIARGLNASPGAASGRVVLSPERAVELSRKGDRVILVREETSADDIHGMYAAQGILTARGGSTSHAAVVSRQLGKPSVVGCAAVQIDEHGGRVRIGKTSLAEGDSLSVDGTTGEVMLGNVPTRDSEIVEVLEGRKSARESRLYRDFERLLRMADSVRRLAIRANADVPADAELAMRLGAQGIGLCRTEHMFFAEDRVPVVREMILARTPEERARALEKLLPLQKQDFKGLFRAMKGQPIAIRTLDPPLHEFLPPREQLLVETTTERLRSGDSETLREKEELLRRVEELWEINPMLGHRGCRLGITYPEITAMQARAIFEAACELQREGLRVTPEIMVPLVGYAEELRHERKIIDRVAGETFARLRVKLQYTVGTMIEVPRAALTAAEIAREAEFFSFGTNDLTQMALGFSRDDAGKFLGGYLEKGILQESPFVTLDIEGVGRLVRMALEEGRASTPGLKVGICGEHGGDPLSIDFFHRAGLDYVSCSPWRVPVARLAAAQAALRARGAGSGGRSTVTSRYRPARPKKKGGENPSARKRPSAGRKTQVRV